MKLKCPHCKKDVIVSEGDVIVEIIDNPVALYVVFYCCECSNRIGWRFIHEDDVILTEG